MNIEKIEVGPLGVNCYLLGDEAARVGIIIDPGAEPETILKRVKNLKLDIKSIVITHGHFDHTGALKEIKDATGADIAIHAEDARRLGAKDPMAATFGISYSTPPAPNRLLKDGDIIRAGSLQLQVLHTPGHTPGSICLLGDGVVFTGDTLFCSGIGRTDLPGGSPEKILDSIRNKLMVLPGNTTVYPGHGPETTIGQERRNNPFLQGY
ncbi:MAG: MBL fold metallo-hydrolase [Dehalococcoidales bacterium]|nr:MBL fold metallo-hydrolase [Dehalococcoidales bacterium]